MFTIIVGGSHDFIKECREVADNVNIKIMKEASSIEDVVSLIQKLVPHAVLIPGEWAPKAASLANEFRNTKIFVSGGIPKSLKDEWDEKGLFVYVVSGKTYKALVDIEAHLKFTSPTNFRHEKTPEKTKEVAVLPHGFFFYESFPTVQDLVSKNPVAVFVEADEGEGVIKKIKALRREYRLSSAPIIVVGECDVSGCYAAGADECIMKIDNEAIERIRNRANRMSELWRRAIKDDLTGLYKRSFLDDYLKEQERRYQETGVPFTVIIADLDHFKAVNDNHGHQAGDIVLKEYAGFLISGARQTDVVARYGGEEFLIVFPGLSETQALEIIEKLCRRWADKEIDLPDGSIVKSTFSAGLAVIGKDATDVGGMIAAADAALYNAKKNGRNRVVANVENNKQIKSSRVVGTLGKSNKFKNKVLAPIPVNDVISEIERHQIITVWNYDGVKKHDIAVEISLTLHGKKKKVLLVEYDFTNPIIDLWAGLPVLSRREMKGRDIADIGGGLQTLGDKLLPEYASGLIKCSPNKKVRVDYLPAGNDLGVINGRYADVDVYERIVEILNGYDHIVIDTEVTLNSPTTKAAIRCADALVIPVSTGPERYEKIRQAKENVLFVRCRPEGGFFTKE